MEILVVVWYSYPNIRQTSWASNSRIYQQPLWDWRTSEQTHILYKTSVTFFKNITEIYSFYISSVSCITYTCHLTRLFIEFSFAASLRAVPMVKKKKKKEAAANQTWLGLKIKSPRFLPSVTVEVKIFHVFPGWWALGLHERMHKISYQLERDILWNRRHLLDVKQKGADFARRNGVVWKEPKGKYTARKCRLEIQWYFV